MTAGRHILLVVPDDAAATLPFPAPGPVLPVAPRALADVPEDAAGAVVIASAAAAAAPGPCAEFSRRSLAPVLLLRAGSDGPPAMPCDDEAAEDRPEDAAARLRLLLEFGDLRRRAAGLGLPPDELRRALAPFGLGRGLVGDRWLAVPGRVGIEDLADPVDLHRQIDAVCGLMGTAFGTFVPGRHLRGLDPEAPALAATSPYCAFLSGRRGLCLEGERAASAEAMRSTQPGERWCPGGIRIYAVPVTLSFGGLAWPLFAATVAAGTVPDAKAVAAAARDYGADQEVLHQIAEESRFWVLNPDKVEGIRATLSNLARAVSREASQRYAAAYHLFLRVLTERERQRSERRLAEANERLAEKSREVFELTHAITHDLRKPLTSLSALVGTLRSGRLGPVAEGQREAIETCHDAAKYMEALVDDLLESARLDAGRRPLERSPVPPGPVVARVLRRFAPEAAERGVALETGPLPETVFADPDALEKVLMNLVGNSLSYIGDGEKRIRVEGEEAPEETRIRVIDTGIGIPPECLPGVFDRFRRGTNVGAVRGTGLGLAIVRGLVEAHGGRVAIASEVGRGTQVTVHLPAGAGLR